MKPRKLLRTQGMIATEAMSDAVGSASMWFVCIQTYPEGNALPQSFSRYPRPSSKDARVPSTSTSPRSPWPKETIPW